MKKLPLFIIPEWINSIQSKKLNKQILENVIWEQKELKIYGKNFLAPRLTAFIASKNIIYKYSGVTHTGNGWPNWFSPLLIDINKFCNTEFNACLINLYRDGNDCMGWHSDNEKEIDNRYPIASLSLGSARDFLVKHKVKNIKKNLLLSNGDLLIMKPSFQTNWLHSIPRRKKVKKSRLNLTFRKFHKY